MGTLGSSKESSLNLPFQCSNLNSAQKAFSKAMSKVRITFNGRSSRLIYTGQQ